MTTITIKQDLPLKHREFGNVAELFSALEEENLFVMLYELAEDEVTDEVKKLARQTREEFDKDASNFADL